MKPGVNATGIGNDIGTLKIAMNLVNNDKIGKLKPSFLEDSLSIPFHLFIILIL